MVDREALAIAVGLRDFGVIVPGRGRDQHVDVRAIGSVGIGEDPVGGSLEIAAMALAIGKRVLTDEVHLDRLVRRRGQIARLGQHARLDRQKIAEDARQRHDRIDARTLQLLERDQHGTADAVIGIEPWPCTHQRHGLGKRRPAGLQIVRAPEHNGDRFRQATISLHVAFQHSAAWRSPS